MYQEQDVIRTAIVNALEADQDIVDSGVEVLWAAQENSEAGYPRLVYTILDETGQYVMPFGFVGSEQIIQIDIATDDTLSGMNAMDKIAKGMKTAMHSLQYRLANSSPELPDNDLAKVTRSFRWENWNV